MTALTTVNVLCRASDQLGNPIAGAVISAKLSGPDVDATNGYVLPESISGVADANGLLTLALWPNALGSTETHYDIKITNPDTGKKISLTATIPNATCELHLVAGLPPYEGKSDGQLIIDAAVAAVAPAVAAKLGAEAALASATTQAGISTAQATIATTQASASSASAAAALASQNSAAGSANTAATQAGIATVQAGNSAASAGAALASQGAAAVSANTATGQADIATAKAAAALFSAGAAETQAGIATAQAGTATTQAGVATTQAGIATTQAGLAAGDVVLTHADVALTHADVVTTNAGAATSTTKAGIATTQATNAAASAVLAQDWATKTAAEVVVGQGFGAKKYAQEASVSETGAAALATNAAASAASAAGSATSSTTQAGIATTKAGESSASAAAALISQNSSAANAGIATAQNTAAGVSAAASASSATQSAAARDLSIAAWAASMAPAETLPAISKSLHFGAVVKAIIYDTSKDSDGGAWRMRCQDKSWYTETLGFTGVWRNQLASTSAAWAVPGAAAGDGFQNTTDGKYYVLTGTATASEIFRGNVREFPEQISLLAQNTPVARVVAYDTTQVGTPLWRVFLYPGKTITSMAVSGGKLLVGTTTGVFVEDLIADRIGLAEKYTTTTTPAIINNTVNDVAITVLDDAPIDPATGLPVPTIAAATAGGVSVIKDSGTISSSTSATVLKIRFLRGSELLMQMGTYLSWKKRSVWEVNNFDPYGTALTYRDFFNNYPVNTIGNGTTTGYTAGKTEYFSDAVGVKCLVRHGENVGLSLGAAITNAYNSGWMVGDISGAWLADTVAETITASGELVSNGTFATDATGWTALNGASLGVASGELTVTNSGATAGGATQAITTVSGKTYVATCTARIGTATPVNLKVGTTSGGAELASASTTSASNATLAVTFTATGTTTYVSAINDADSGGTGIFDNISVKLAEPDRSVKNNGLTVNGSLTKTAVASGANLMAYSGFGSANYLKQPYSANLDFGTGDFCVMGWYQNAVPGVSGTILSKSSPSSITVPYFELQTDGVSVAWIGNNGSSKAQGVTSVKTGKPVFICFKRSAGIGYLYINDQLEGSAANTDNYNHSNADTLQFACRQDGSTSDAGNISLALWRISATAPSDEQIKHIYRTELPLFQANAKCTIDGTSTAVTALAYDEDTDLLHVGTSWGRTSFHDLVRVDSEATTTGALTSLSASQGAILTGGTSAKYYQPAMLLRDELRRKAEARKALGKTPVFFEFDAVTSQVAFVLPKGYTCKAVYSAGALKRAGSTKDYLVSTDGFSETVTFAVAPGNGVWVSVMGVRA